MIACCACWTGSVVPSLISSLLSAAMQAFFAKMNWSKALELKLTPPVVPSKVCLFPCWRVATPTRLVLYRYWTAHTYRCWAVLPRLWAGQR